MLSLHIRSTVLDLNQSPFQPSILPLQRNPWVTMKGTTILLMVTSTGEEPRDVLSVALHVLLPSQILFVTNLKLTNTDIIKLPWGESLICFNHLSLEFQAVIPQSHILKFGMAKGCLTQSGVPRMGNFAQATE